MGNCIPNKLTRLLLNDQPVPHTLLQYRYEMEQIRPNMTDENSVRLCKIRNMFEILNMTFSKFYSPSEHLTAEGVIFFSQKGSFSDNRYPTNKNFWHQTLPTIWRNWIKVYDIFERGHPVVYYKICIIYIMHRRNTTYIKQNAIITIGWHLATCFSRDRPSSGQLRTTIKVQ